MYGLTLNALNRPVYTYLIVLRLTNLTFTFSHLTTVIFLSFIRLYVFLKQDHFHTSVGEGCDPASTYTRKKDRPTHTELILAVKLRSHPIALTYGGISLSILVNVHLHFVCVPLSTNASIFTQYTRISLALKYYQPLRVSEAAMVVSTKT